MKWSKNFTEERDCSDQILLEAEDWMYCVLLSLAIHLETWIETGKGRINLYVFGLAKVSEDPDNSLKWTVKYAYIHIKAVYGDPSFVVMGKGPLGTHSLYMYPSTKVRRNGCGRDDIDS